MSARARSLSILTLMALTLTTSCWRPSTTSPASPLPTRCEPAVVEVPTPAIDCQALAPIPTEALATLRALPPCRGPDGVRLVGDAPCRTAAEAERGDLATAAVLRWGSDLWRCAALAAGGAP